MKRQHSIRESEKSAAHLVFWGIGGIVIENVDGQVQCIWMLS